MTWTEEYQAEIDRLVADKPLSEVIAHAVGNIATGHVGCFACYRLGQSESFDPRQNIDFGERLLVAAIDALIEKVTHGKQG